MKQKKTSVLPDNIVPGNSLSSPGDELLNVKLSNWAGNIEFSTSQVFYPGTVAEVQNLVQNHTHLKALGARHCFNRIADSRYSFVSTRELNQVVSLNTEARTVTVEAGIKYGELAPYLHQNNFALPNLASLPHISVAGSIITATHGSGVANGNLATPVISFEMVTADGSVVTISKENNQEAFNGMVVNLGALGIITKVTLAIEPTFSVQQNIYENLPLTQLLMHFNNIMATGYSVSLFTDWTTDNINQVWIKSRIDEKRHSGFEQAFYGASAASQNRHPIMKMPAENCTEQMGVPGPWHERLPHFKMGFMPSSGQELQSEYFVPYQHAGEAIMAVARLGKLISPHLLISEIRTIAADDFWLSPCYQRPSVALHFTWKPDWFAVSKVLPVLERELAPFQVRPHWGKLFTMSAAELATRYEKLPAFINLASEYDPQGKFRNAFLDTTIYGK